MSKIPVLDDVLDDVVKVRVPVLDDVVKVLPPPVIVMEVLLPPVTVVKFPPPDPYPPVIVMSGVEREIRLSGVDSFFAGSSRTPPP
jgi:hypothetical protein